VKIDNNICYGQSDIELTDNFKNEINIIKNKINFPLNMVFYSSPLIRCRLLAKELTKKKIIIDKRLLELNFGDWELNDWKSIRKSELNKWLNNIKKYTCPNGESYLDLYKRSKDFFNDLIKENHKEVSIITHAGVIRSILSYVLKITLDNSFIINIDYGNISKIIVNSKKKSHPIYNIEYINK